MTREQAIKILNTVLFFGKCDCPKEEIKECLKLAIKALEQEPILDKIRAEIDNSLSDGMIHKKTVLEVIDKYFGEDYNK